MSDHDSLGEWSGAYVLGALEPGERSLFEGHLAECEKCQADVADFAPIPALLARVDTFEPVAVPEALLHAVNARVASERRTLVVSRRRWRAVSAAAVVALVFVLFGGFGPDEPVVQAFDVDPAWGVVGQVTLSPRGWGTEVGFNLGELPPGVTCIAWAVDDGGEWQQVAWWGPTESHRAVVTGASSLQVGDLDAVVITTTNRDEIVTRAVVEDAVGG